MRFFLLAAAVCGVVAASSVARAETPIPDYRFSDAPYSNPPPVYPAPRDGWPFRPRARSLHMYVPAGSMDTPANRVRDVK